MDWVTDIHTAEALLMQYSEWLDPTYMRAPDDGDSRTHEQLVQDFLVARSADARPKVLV